MNDSLQTGGHPMMNHMGRTIFVTQSTLRALDMRHYLRRDQGSGLLMLKPKLFTAFNDLEGGDHHTKFFQELGPDCSGPNVTICRCYACRRMESDIDHTLTPDDRLLRIHEEASAAVKAVKAKRR